MIIGIDLGTSTTEAAIYRNGKVEMIPNSEGKIITPSAIGLDANGDIIIGESARAQYCIYPERTAIEVKRKLGTSERIRLGDKSYTPVELSSMLLKYVKGCAEAYLGEEIKHVVISVPAYFNDIQRQDVIKAGECAGLVVERLINEPTAAALSYGINHMAEESHILVYDLGGGTFDVTLLEMFEGVLEVKASSGDNQLGGKDFDECLIKHLKECLHKNSDVSLENDSYAEARLKEQAEQCKIELSTKESFNVRLPMLTEKDGMPIGLDAVVTKEEFEALIDEYVKRTHGPIYTALSDGRVETQDLDRVLLVGGSTRVPLVRKDLEELLNMEPSSAIHPDYSVAEGAAIQAAIIDGLIEPENSLVMTDVNPFSLGVQVVNGFEDDCMSVIIPRNTTIPVTRKDVYYTFVNNQREAEINVYQGEHRKASRNHFLGKFIVDNIPPASAGKESIEVAFSYDLSGLLRVEATIQSTKKTGNLTVNMLEAGRNTRVDVSDWKSSPYASGYRTTVRRAERMLKKLSKDDVIYDDIDELVYELKKAVIDGDIDQADDVEDELKILIGEVL